MITQNEFIFPDSVKIMPCDFENNIIQSINLQTRRADQNFDN